MISTAPHPLSAQVREHSQIRITGRGRLVLVGLVAALAFALVSLGQVAAQAVGSDAGSGSGAAVSTTWVVQPGETLWVIAQRVSPDTDPRDTVARIVAMNDLPNSSVLVGQELQIPA